MTELEIANSQIVQLRTQCVLLRGEVVSLKEKLAAARRNAVGDYLDDFTLAELDREREHRNLERGAHE